jgi:hypothetical protein
MIGSEQKKHPQNVNFEGIFMSRIYVQGTISKQQESHLDGGKSLSGRKKGIKYIIKSGVPKRIRTPVAGVKGSQHQIA